MKNRAPARRREPRAQVQKELDDAARSLAPLVEQHVFRHVNRPACFVLWLFTRDGPEFTFISNTSHEDMHTAVEKLKESEFWTRGVRGMHTPASSSQITSGYTPPRIEDRRR